MIRLSWVVFVHAVLLSFESIVIEILIVRLQLSPLVISAISIPLAGAIILALSVMLDKTKEKTASLDVFLGWKHLLAGSAFLAAGVFLWYDSVGRIGASKEGLLAGPFETVAILLLARLFLKERLSSLQAIGILIALGGFFLTTLSGHPGGSDTTTQQWVTFGDIEALLSAVSFAAGVIFLGKMAKSYRTAHVTGASLLVSGLILLGALWTLEPPVLSLADWPILVAFSVIPLAAALSYIAGLARIGASLTSTIASFSIILTVLFQLIMLHVGIEVLLPERIVLAVVGGMFGVLGIYLVHRKQDWKT